jgi:hypothetical protein
MHLLLSLFLAAVVKDPGATLRSGCNADSPAVAKLEAGTELRIRYALSGEKGPCYKVAASWDGSTAEGYLPGTAIGQIESFEDARKGGGVIQVRGGRRTLPTIKNPVTSKPSENFRPVIQGNHTDEQIYGTRVLLRYESAAISIDTARQMALTVDQEFARISAQLGCAASDRIVTIAESLDAYRKTTGAAEWSGGQFDGQIHLPVVDKGRLDDRTRRTLTHEITHACLSMMGRWPTWLQEGVAHYISGEELADEDRKKITQLARAEKLPALSSLADNWSGLDAEGARVAYDHALRAIEVFNRDFGAYGLRNLLNNPSKVPQYASEIDKRLGQ